MSWAPPSFANCWCGPASGPARSTGDPRPGADCGPGPEPGPPGGDPCRPVEGFVGLGLNQVCGSGLRAIALGMQRSPPETRRSSWPAAGSMSLSPHAQHLRAGVKMGDFKMIDTMIRMGCGTPSTATTWATPPNVAKQFQITRDDQDQFALASQNKAEAAPKAGRFKVEIVAFTVKGRKGDTVVDQDEYIRHGATIDAMTEARLRQGRARHRRQRFRHQRRRSRRAVDDRGGSLPARHHADCPHRLVGDRRRRSGDHGHGADPASRRALEGRLVGRRPRSRRGQRPSRRSLRGQQDMGWNPDIVNVNGGAIAIGHPISASGARIFNTLVHEMKRRGAKGLATLCIGGGMGVAMCVEGLN